MNRTALPLWTRVATDARLDREPRRAVAGRVAGPLADDDG
ncbi:hypothetical protein SSPS47_01040 [Streptomyces sp. S4.7]|nr:hypothetical protein SSPS47_01040 [Streptomyces sp. S4.7]